MQISFKGFKNTGIGVETNTNVKLIKKRNATVVIPPYAHLTLNATLNNINQNDLEKFGEIIKKFPNKHQPDSINFHYDKYYSTLTNTMKQEFWLNDKPLILSDKNLKIFSLLSKLFERLSKTEIKDHTNNKDYLVSDKCKLNFQYFLKNSTYENDIKNYHSLKNIQNNAKAMQTEIIDTMLNYMEQ